MRLLWLALLPWLAAPLVLGLAGRRSAPVLAGGVALAGVALLLTLAPAVFAGQVLVWRVEWVAQLGLGFGLRLDGLAWLLAFMITGIGALVVLYGAWYLDPKNPAPRFFAFLLLFMGAMLGVVLADNLVLLVIFWELTSLSSFLLIGYWHHRQDAREGARMALTITGAGGLCLFAGVLLIGHIVGSYQLDVVLGARAVLQEHALFPLALVLVLLGAFTKSAQFPFHFWLPHAMAAPTPVSAYLHSATMVKAGVFLLARFYPLLGGNEWWFWIVSSVGLITLLLGAYVALFQHDLKGLLAYSTISHLGLITLLFGLDEPLAVVAGVFHIINHATFKAGLFMSAGIIDHETGTRDMRKLAGLLRYMPATATLGMLAAASMAGVPLFNGFLSKEMFFAETLAKDGHLWLQWLLPIGATLAGVFSVAYSLRFIHDTFFNGEPKDLPKTPHEAPFFMLLPVGLLVLLCMVVGVLPGLVVGPLLAVAAQAALQAPLPTYSLAVWHGFNLPLAMSVAAVAGGAVVYSALHRRVNLHSLSMVPGWVFAGGRELFLALSQLGVAAAQGLTGWLQNGSLQRYLLLLVTLALIAGVSPFLGEGPSSQMAGLHLNDLNWGVAVVGLLGIAATLATTYVHRQRLLALVLLGATGLVVCLSFAYFSAPDLALTQLLVEVATVMLMMLALHWLPAESTSPSNRLSAWRDAVIAIAVGLGVAALVWMVLTRPGQSISDYFLATTLALGGGANSVNVIIVDYRGFDTMGEITVLGISALILHALLANFNAAPAALSGSADHPLMLQLVARLVLPFTVMVAVFFYLRGHNLPGGGFIGGLVLAIGLLLQAVAHGQSWVAQRSSLDYRAWVGWGLMVAVLSGVASWWFGAPFLTSTYDYPWLPGIGGVPLASASLFDAGVFLVVVGATMVMLLSIARLTRKTGR